MKNLFDYFLTGNQNDDRVRAAYQIATQFISQNESYSVDLEGYGRQLKFLVEKFPEILSLKDDDGNTLLHLAADKTRKSYKTELEIVETLVGAGADLFNENNAGLTPMQIAFSGAKIHLVGYFSEKAKKILDDELLSAMMKADLDRMLAALKKGASPYTKVPEGVSIDVNGFQMMVDRKHAVSVLHIACATRRSDIVELVLDSNIPIHDEAYILKDEKESEYTPYQLSIFNDDVDTLRLLVKKYDIMNSAFFHAAASGAMECLKMLVNDGIDVNAKTESGHTALHSAAYNGSMEGIKFLIDNGARIGDVDDTGFNALHWQAFSSYGDYVECARYLIDKGIDVDATTKGGKTATAVAEDKNNYEIAEFLAQYPTIMKEQNVLAGMVNSDKDSYKGMGF